MNYSECVKKLSEMGWHPSEDNGEVINDIFFDRGVFRETLVLYEMPDTQRVGRGVINFDLNGKFKSFNIYQNGINFMMENDLYGTA